jgi:TonB family protein
MSQESYGPRPETAPVILRGRCSQVAKRAGHSELDDRILSCRRPILISLLALVVLLLVPPTPSACAFEDPNIEKYAVKKVQPPYPEMAEKYHIEGIVVVKVSVASDGKVTQAEFVRGPNIFRSVSLDAAKRWSFKPPPNEALAGTIHFTFKLNSSG